MKIILINNLYEPFNRGGTEKITKIITEEFTKKGHQVFIITTKPRFRNNFINEQKNIIYLDSLYYHLNRIPFFIKIFWHIFNIFNFINYFKIKKILRQENPDIVLANNLIGIGFLAPRAIKKTKAKYIQYLHDVQLLHPSGLIYFGEEKKLKSIAAKIYQNIAVRLFSYPDMVISPSRWLLNLHQNFFKHSKKICLLSPALNHLKKNNKNQNNQYFNFFYAGQMETHKGIFFLADSFSKIKDDNITLTMIGSGSKLSILRKKCSQDKRIQLIEWPGDQKMRTFLQKADALIVPSFCYENSPTIIYEAASIGIPVIASKIGGITELIEKLGGLLFEPNNTQSLIEMMEKIKNDEILRKKIIDRENDQIKDCYLEKYINQLELYFSQ
jgi:glycosyltransferase involved in cell wall biosynthesis